MTRALVIDDRAADCELLCAVLKSAGIDADSMTNSAAAAEVLHKTKFDAVFLDLRMPPPGGMDLTRQIRSGGMNLHTPVTMMTADPDPQVLTRGFEAGANYFLFKPIDPQRVMKVIRAAHAQVVREKHRFQRIPHRCHVSLESRGEKWEGETMDLSLGGMLLEAGASFPFAEKVEVRLKIPNQKEPLRATGRVVRVSREGCQGVEFIKFAPGAGELLQTFLLPAILAQIGEPQAEKSRRTDHWV